MINTPRGNRVHIALFGRTNVGKSSLINRITGQSISVVSEIRGTTTDPVYKAMELLPIGPVVFIDTPGIDDDTIIGNLRVERTEEVLNKMDLALLIISAEDILNKSEFEYEKLWLKKIKEKKKPFIVVVNKCDLLTEKGLFTKELDNLKKILNSDIILVSTFDIEDSLKVKNKIIELAPKLHTEGKLIGDKITTGDSILLVAPQDIQAPKGRLILPQVQVIRDILDNGGIPTVVTLDNLENGLDILGDRLKLVITDSQAFDVVNKKVDTNTPLTSFSIIMARAKGDLDSLYEGAKAIDKLQSGDKVLIAEACTHHQLKGDIAREKIPHLLKSRVKDLIIENCSGKDFPKNLNEYALVIHCGSCMLNRAETMSRIDACDNKKIAITNFGMALAQMNGILDRVMEIFK